MRPKQLPRKLYKIGSYVMGSTSGFSGNKWFDIILDNLPEYLIPGNKAYVEEFELKLTMTFGTLANDPALQSIFLNNTVDTEVYGPGSFRISSRKGWHDPLWAAIQDGRVYGARCLDLPTTGGSPGSYTRTFTKHIRFVDDFMSSRFARCIPAIAFAKAAGKLRVFVHAAAEAIKGLAGLSVSACTIDLFAHLIDIPAQHCIMPVLVEEQSNDGIKDTNPGPDIGAYMRLVMANGPQFASGGWANTDDLSAYTSLDLFGDPGNYTIIDRPVDLHMRQVNEDLSQQGGDPHQFMTAAATPGAATPVQKSEFRVYDPVENFDGKLRGIPLVYQRYGADIADIPRWYGKKPTLKANNNSPTGLPPSVDVLYQRVVARDQKWITSIMGAVSPRATGRNLVVPPGYMKDPRNEKLGAKPGVDLSRVPLFFDGR